MNVTASMDGYLYSNYFSLVTNTLPFNFDVASKLFMTQMAILGSNKWMYYPTGILCNGIVSVTNTLSGLDVVALDTTQQLGNVTHHFSFGLHDNYMQIYVYVRVKLLILASTIHVLSIIIISLVTLWLINISIQYWN